MWPLFAFSLILWGSQLYLTRFQAWDTLQVSTDNSSIDKVETSLEQLEQFSQLQDMTEALPCHIHLPVCLWIMDPRSRAAKKNTSHGNEVLPQGTTHLIQRPCYQWGSQCQDLTGNQISWRPPDLYKETQTEVVQTCLPLVRSGENHLARHSERGKQTKKMRKEVGRQYHGQASSLPSPRGQWRTEKNGGNQLWSHLMCLNNPHG